MNKFIDKHFSQLMILIAMIIIMFGGMWLMRREMPPRVVKIDLVAITQHYTQAMLTSTLNNPHLDTNNAQVKQISEVIRNNLEPIIANYAKEHNVVVVQAQALVSSNVADITPLIINQLDSKIK